MASNTRDLIFRIVGDAKGMNKATKEAETGLAGFEARVGKIGGLLAGAFAGGAIVNFAKQAAQAALEDSRAQERLAKTLQNVTAATAEQIAAVEASISRMQSQFAVADDELRPAFETLVRATKDTAQAQQLLQLALDVSAGSGKGLQEVSVALVKAMGGQMRGLRDLGIEVKTASGETATFADVQAQLNEMFGGQAATAADSQTGRMRALSIQYEELKESIGAALLPVMVQLAQVATTLFGWFNALDEGTQKFIVSLAAFGGIAYGAVKAFTAIRAAVAAMNLAMAATPWGLIAAGASALAALSFGLLKSGDDSEEAKEQTEKYAKAVQGLGLNAETTTKLVEGLNAATNDRATPDQYEDVRNAIRALGLNAEDTAVLLGVVGKQGVTFTDKLKELTPEGQAAARALQDITNYAHDLPPAIQYGTKAVDGLAGSTADLGAEADTTMARLEEFSRKMHSTGQSASEMAREIIGAADRILARFDKGFAANKAQLEFEESLKTLKEDLKGLTEGSLEYNVTLEERADAAKKSAEATVDAALSLRGLNGVEREIARNQSLINYFSDIRKSLDPNNPLMQYLDRFINDLLKEIPGTYDARINVTVAGMPGIAASDIPGNNFGMTPDQINAMLTGLGLKKRRRAAGGPVMAGTSYIVGEEGPEVFVPGASGTIIPNGVGVGGGNITINVTAPTGTDPYTFGNAVVSALKSYVRSNGKLVGLTA